MHPSDNTGRDRPDRELDDYLAGRSPLSARYRAASRETPAPELGRAILDHARAAVRQTPAMRPSWQQRWAVPVGIAATLVVGVDLAWRVSDRARSETAASESVAVVLSEDAGMAQRPQRLAAAAPPGAESRIAAATETPQPEADLLAEPAGDALLRQEAAEIQASEETERVEAAKAEAAVREDSVDPAAGDAFVVDAPDAGSFAPPPAASSLAESPAYGEQDAEVIEAERALREAKVRSAQRRADAPLAAMMAAPEPAVPRRSAEAARSAADEVSALLRTREFDRLRERYTAAALTRQALEGAATVFEGSLNLRLIEDPDGTWRADYFDASGQLRCALRLRPVDDGWALVGLATRP